MRDQTLNSFNDGLNTDLNAMVTPNTVMTDCLNGTLITYNGNEFVLQNDMGNGKVESAYLPTGFVPVGMKENGGIIYVASYNPLTKESQLGSFPSPERNIENEDFNANNELSLPKGSMEDTSLKVFADEIKLQSGNKFCIGLPSFISLNAPNIDDVTYNFIDAEGKLYTGQNRRYNVTLNIINSDGILMDVTDTCKPIPYPNEENIEGYYFFITKKYSTGLNNEENTVNEYEKYLTSYSNKLSGIPFIKVQNNKVFELTISVSPKKSSKATGPNDNSETDVELLFEIAYKYNGPIYGYSYKSTSSTEDCFEKDSNITKGLAGFKIYYGYEPDFYKGTESKIELLLKNILFTDGTLIVSDLDLNNYFTLNFDVKLLFNTQLENNGSGVCMKLSNSIKLNTIIYYAITPIYFYEDDPLLKEEENEDIKGLYDENLTYFSSVDVNKISSDYNVVNTWRYFVDDKWLTLTWGMESYPSSENTRPRNVKFEFFDVKDLLNGKFGNESNYNNVLVYSLGNELGQIGSLDYENYNGMFTVPISIEEYSETDISQLQINPKKIYLVRISWNDISDTIRNTCWRYVITTSLDNMYYWSVQDFINICDVNQKPYKIQETPEKWEDDPEKLGHIRNLALYPSIDVDDSVEFNSSTPEVTLIRETATKTGQYEIANITDEYIHRFNVRCELSIPDTIPCTGSISNIEWTIGTNPNHLEGIEKNESLDKNYKRENPLLQDNYHTAIFTYNTPMYYILDADLHMPIKELFTAYSARNFSNTEMGSQLPALTIYVHGSRSSGHDPSYWIHCAILTNGGVFYDGDIYEYHGHIDLHEHFNSWLLDTIVSAYISKGVKNPLIIGIHYALEGHSYYNYLIWDGEKYIFAYKNPWHFNYAYYDGSFFNISGQKENPYAPKGPLKDYAICLGTGTANQASARLAGSEDAIKSLKLSSITTEEKINFYINYTVGINYYGEPYNEVIEKAVNNAVVSIEATRKSEEEYNIILNKLKNSLLLRIPTSDSTIAAPRYSSSIKRINSLTGTTYSIPRSEYSIKGDKIDCTVTNTLSGNEDLYETIKNAVSLGIDLMLCYKDDSRKIKYVMPDQLLEPNSVYKINFTYNSKNEKCIVTEEVPEYTIGTMKESSSMKNSHIFVPAKGQYPDYVDRSYHGRATMYFHYGDVMSAELNWPS